MPSLLKTASPHYERIKKMDFKQKLIDFENNFLKELYGKKMYEHSYEHFASRANHYIKKLSIPINKFVYHDLIKMMVINNNMWLLSKAKEIKDQFSDLGLNFDIDIYTCLRNFHRKQDLDETLFANSYMCKYKEEDDGDNDDDKGIEEDYRIKIRLCNISFNKEFTKSYNDMVERMKNEINNLTINFSNQNKFINDITKVISDNNEAKDLAIRYRNNEKLLDALKIIILDDQQVVNNVKNIILNNKHLSCDVKNSILDDVKIIILDKKILSQYELKMKITTIMKGLKRWILNKN
jgi:hypothetical protein